MATNGGDGTGVRVSSHGGRPGSAVTTRGSGPGFAEQDLPVALMFVVFASVACTIPAQSDTFYHLSSGQRIWESEALIRSEQFSWTHPGRSIVNHWWLSQLGFYGLYSIGGPVLLTVVAGGVAFSASLLSWSLVRGHRTLLFGALIALVLTVPEWSVRPQVFSLLFTALMLRLIVSERLLFLLMVVVLWANTHAVVVLGVALACVPFLDAILWDRLRIGRGLLTAGCAIAASTLTPFGFDYWTSMLSTVDGSRAPFS